MRSLLIGWIATLPLALSNPLMELPAELKNVPAGEWRMFETALQPGAGSPCCVDWNKRSGAAACGLDGDGWSFNERPAPPDEQLRVFVRLDGKGIDRVEAFGSSCTLDAPTRAVPRVVLAATTSTRLLTDLARQSSQRVSEGATGALALQAGTAVDEALRTLAQPGEGKQTRRAAAFWLTQVRGEKGFQAVRQLLAGPDESRDFRRHAVFALSQSKSDGRDQALIELSESDRDREIRGEALFWLAQVSPEAAEPALLAAARGTDRHVTDKAIFGISQLPKERAVKQLAALAADRSLSRETRKQALFWLSQADPDSALPEVDRLLGVEAK